MKHSPSLLPLFLLLLLSPLSKATTIINYNHFDDFAGGDTDLPLDQPPPLPPPIPDTAESPPSDDGGDGSDDGDTTQLLPTPPPPLPPSEPIEYTPPFSAPSGIDLPPPPSPFGILPPTIGGSGSGTALPFGQPTSNGFGQPQQHPLSGFGQQQQQQQLQGLNGGSQLPLVDNTPYDSGCERIREGVVMMLCSFVVFFYI